MSELIQACLERIAIAEHGSTDWRKAWRALILAEISEVTGGIDTPFKPILTRSGLHVYDPDYKELTGGYISVSLFYQPNEGTC